MKITGKIYLLVMILCIAGILYSCNRSLDNSEEAVFTESLIAGESFAVQETKQQDLQSMAQESANTYVTVHICGAVKKPGVYTIPAGSRYAEALQAAGGITKDGAEDYLNLAGIVNDGEKLYVPFLKEVEDPYGRMEQETAQGKETVSAYPDSNNELVNINTATLEELQTLNGIGEVRAKAIIAYRQSNTFTAIEDIMLVPGIKEGAFAKIKDSITV